MAKVVPVSDYALLDVQKGRKKLKKRVEKGERPKVSLEGYIDCVFGEDDGTSREFCVVVTKVTISP